MGGWFIVLVLAATPPLLVAAALVGGAKDRRRLPGWLQEHGYRALSIEKRYLTSGPFRNVSLPGTKHGDQLYRILATDERGVDHIVWVLMPTGSILKMGQPPEWELRVDPDPARTRAGLGTSGFFMLALALAAVVLGGIVFISRSAAAH